MIQPVRLRLRQAGAQLGKRRLRGVGQGAVAHLAHLAQAQHQRLQLVLVEVERGQGGILYQAIAEARRTVDHRAKPAQGVDIAIDGAGGHVEPVRQRLRRGGGRDDAQGLHQFEKAFGPGHGAEYDATW